MKLNHNPQIEYHILKVLDEMKTPAGTWHINKVIQDKDIRISQATVGRILFKLEEQGFLEKAGGQKGRKMTKQGQAYLNKLEKSTKRDEYLRELAGSLQKDSLESAYQLIQVRKLLEPAASYEAAIHATGEEAALMKQAIKQQAEALHTNNNATKPSMDFHLCIAKSCNNPILTAFIQVLLEERKNNEIIEAVGWMRNTRSECDHEMIQEAIERHDPDAAQELMLQHLERIENLVKQEIERTRHEERE